VRAQEGAGVIVPEARAAGTGCEAPAAIKASCMSTHLSIQGLQRPHELQCDQIGIPRFLDSHHHDDSEAVAQDFGF